MATPLTLAEFKVRLADRDARERLGVHLSDQEALLVLVDDQRIADLYVQWRTEPPTSASPPATQRPVPGFWRRPTTWVIGGVVVVALVVGGSFLVNGVMENNRKQEFAQILRDDPTVSPNLRELEGELLDAVYSSTCRKVSGGWTERDQAAASENNWPAVAGTSNVTEAQFKANNMATFRAGVKVCG